ncbi:MAG TPA: alpha/beta fold hydrolase [Bacilli bacterium]|nr:alpha/beta fold hydrolase [Bacilli bacterium]
MKQNKAILIIHGFAGGPYDEEPISNYLELKSYDVFNFTLPGHDKMLFNKITKDDWINSCREHLELLISNNYEYITVIGHSMGGVLACILASEYKEITRLVLAAPAFKYLTFEEEDFKFLTALKNSSKLFEDYSKEEIIARILQFPMSVIKEFMTLIKENYDIPSKIDTPTLIIQGKNDKVVPVKSAEYVYKTLKSKNKHLMLLDEVTHDVFKGKKVNDICIAIEQFIRNGRYTYDEDKKY